MRPDRNLPWQSSSWERGERRERYALSQANFHQQFPFPCRLGESRLDIPKAHPHHARRFHPIAA
jgi:hypothetical protein